MTKRTPPYSPEVRELGRPRDRVGCRSVGVGWHLVEERRRGTVAEVRDGDLQAAGVPVSEEVHGIDLGPGSEEVGSRRKSPLEIGEIKSGDFCDDIRRRRV